MSKSNHLTPLENVLFRCSKIGVLAEGIKSQVFSKENEAELKELIKFKNSYQKITDKQQISLSNHLKDEKQGITLSNTKKAEKDRLQLKLKTKNVLSKTKQERLDYLQNKKNAKPELTKGAKTLVRKIWLKLEKNFDDDFEINSKQVKKGKQAEEDGINLISFIDGYMYSNNNLNENKGRVTIGNLTGAADVVTYFDVIESKIIDDIKCSWNPETFMSTNYSKLEEWQGRGYMYLYDADIFRIRRVLVDCPPDVYADELKKFCWDNYIIDGNEDNEEYKPLIDQFKANLIYSDSPLYTMEERHKMFAFSRDKELEKIMLKSIELAKEYYSTLTLNIKEL